MKFFSLLFFSVFLFVSAPGQVLFEDYCKSRDLTKYALSDIELKDYLMAVQRCQLAISYDSMNRSAYVNLNYAGSRIGDYAMLVGYLKMAVKIFKDDDELLYYTGNAFQKLNQIDSAVYYYDKAVKYSKVNGEDYPLVYAYYLNRGICLNLQGKNEQAISDFNYSLVLNESSASAFANRAITLFKLKRVDEACSDWYNAYKKGEANVKSYLDKYCD